MAERLVIDGSEVTDTFDVLMPMKSQAGNDMYYNTYEGVVLEDGRKLIRCLFKGCDWTCPGDQTPGSHNRVHQMTLPGHLRDLTVGEMFELLREVDRLQTRVASLEERLAKKTDKHKEEMKRVREARNEETANWRKRAQKAERVLSAVQGYVPPGN